MLVIVRKLHSQGQLSRVFVICADSDTTCKHDVLVPVRARLLSLAWRSIMRYQLMATPQWSFRALPSGCTTMALRPLRLTDSDGAPSTCLRTRCTDAIVKVAPSLMRAGRRLAELAEVSSSSPPHRRRVDERRRVVELAFWPSGQLLDIRRLYTRSVIELVLGILGIACDDLSMLMAAAPSEL